MSKNRKLRATWVRDTETGKIRQFRTIDHLGMTLGNFRRKVEIDGEEVIVISDSKNGTYVRESA